MNLTEFLNNTVWGGIKWNIALEKRLEDPKYLEAYGYKVYSQNDEDGIIHEIFNRIGTINKSFVEFGVDRGIECNSHSLLLQGWKGMWIEGRLSAYEQVTRRFAPAIRRGELKIVNDYVTVDNIQAYLEEYLQGLELDLLSIDVDGNDYHIWKAISSVKPRVVVIEYQGKFPPEIDWVMAYNKDHVWDRSDRSGASLKALEKLGNEKGYQLVGTNICGVNAFFVRKELCGDLFSVPATSENFYNPVRSNIVGHRNGNMALNYVGQNIEGIEGVFEYYPDWNTLSSFGFWKVEVTPNGRRNVIKEKESKMFVRDIPRDAKYVYIHTNIGIPVELINESLTLAVKIGGYSQEYIINKENQILCLEIDGQDFEESIMAMYFETNVLWNPQIMNGSSENRQRGIAIDSIEFK